MEIPHNYLIQQYKETGVPPINHNYLPEQFADYKEIFAKIEELVKDCGYTLGEPVDEFEKRICELTGANYCIGVGSGTDALFLSLKAAGIQPGDEVITTPYTFFATIGAIVTAGGKPIFVDVADDYNIDPNLIEAAITPKTKFILPVHWSGIPCKMDQIMDIAQRHNLKVIEDACHAINGSFKGQAPGTFGDAGCFSMHPLKNLNVWGDGGFIITNSKEMHDKLVLLRNHGLINRDKCAIYAYNSRLDAIQAIVANHLLDKIEHITDSRIKHAEYFDMHLRDIPQITIPLRDSDSKSVYHIYVIRAEHRDELKDFLLENGIDAKIHYPIPMHLQPASAEFGYQVGDFPNAEAICDSVLSLPVHEFITQEKQDFVIEKIKQFYQTTHASNGVVAPMESNKPKVPFVDLGSQYSTVREEVLEKFDQISRQGMYVLTHELKEFEKNFAAFCGTQFAIGVANGTDAIFLCLKALGIGQGDEVITAPNSFIATAGAIAATGAKPVFVDVDESYNLDPTKLEQAITGRTKAIVPVHLTGRPAAMDEINQIAGRYGLVVIEDAAQAVGAKYKDKSVGNLSVAGCFSLHPLKNLHIHGDGGIITTNGEDMYNRLLKYRNHGLKNRDECDFFAYNSRLDALQAGIGNIKLKHIDEWNKRFREIAQKYHDGLKDLVEVPLEKEYEESVYHNFVIMVDNRQELQDFLLGKGIETKVHYPIPIHMQKACEKYGYKQGDFPVAERQAQRILSLPIYPELSDSQVNLVIEAIREFFS